MGGKRGSQGSSLPESQVHTRSLRGFPWVPILAPALKNVIPGPHVSAAASLPEHHKKKMELLGKSVGVADVSLLGVLRVPTATLGSLLQQLQVDSLMGRDYQLRDHQALLLLNNAVTTQHDCKSQSAGRLSLGELELWQDRITLKGPCSW